MAKKKVETPILDRLLGEGIIWTDGGELVGKGRDGVEVSIGNVAFPEDAERYLTTHPTPETW